MLGASMVPSVSALAALSLFSEMMPSTPVPVSRSPRLLAMIAGAVMRGLEARVPKAS